MKVMMKAYEAWCIEYAAKWNKQATWEMYCIAKDAWLAGYHKAVDICEDSAYLIYGVKDPKVSLDFAGQDMVEIDIGSNQIGMD